MSDGLKAQAVGGKLKLKTKKGAAAAKKVVARPADGRTLASKMTKAEEAFERRQAELRAERVKKKAQTSHRQKVEKLNEHLDNMTELNDIPKVSWTK